MGLVPRYAEVPTAIPNAVRKSAARNNKIFLTNTITYTIMALKKYDTICFMKNVAIIAPAGNIDEIDGLYEAEKFLFSQNVAAKIFKGCGQKFRYMAGDDNTRLEDLHNAFLDPGIDTIICARGGYGAIRLLDKIDYVIIKNNPKKFIGSSDITALLVSVFKNTGLITYHAKMALNGISKMNEREFLKYKNAIENNIYTMPKFNCSERVWKKGGLYPGDGAVLWGGNLATIVSLFGSPAESYVPNEDIVLFLEDINEPDYKIDRMLTQILRNIYLKNKIKAVIFGEFKGAGEYLNEILKEFVDTLNVPYAFDMNITHGANNTIVPVGLKLV